MREAVYKLPVAFLDRMQKIYPLNYENIFSTFFNKKTTVFRINFSKTDLTSLRRELLREKVRSHELTFPVGAFLLKSSWDQFQNTELYQKGLVFVQNVSSMIPPLILDPQPDEKILDLCAAPGAKTSQIISLCSRAEVVAVEKVRKRYYKLLANLKTQGAHSVKVVLYDGMWVKKKFPEYFDKILVDAPCSAEGRFFIPNPRSYQYWKLRKIKEMVSTQKKLLHAAFFALKEGGELVYSTCTFAPEENEEIIDWFIDKFKGKVEVLPVEIPLENVQGGLKRWRGKKFSSSCRLAKRIIPNETMEGFFVVKFKKTSI